MFEFDLPSVEFSNKRTHFGVIMIQYVLQADFENLDNLCSVADVVTCYMCLLFVRLGRNLNEICFMMNLLYS